MLRNQRRRAAALERFVRTGKCNEYGLRTVVGQGAAVDVLFFVAACDRIARILAERGDTDPVGARQSKALGILANPAAAIALIAEHEAAKTTVQDAAEHTGTDTAADDADADGADEPLWPSDLHPAEDDSEDVQPDLADSETTGAAEAGAQASPVAVSARCGSCATCGSRRGRGGDVAAFTRALGGIDPSSLLPRVSLYLHLAREDLDAATGEVTAGTAPGTGVVRMEAAAR